VEVRADRGYDSAANHNGLGGRGIVDKISRRRHPGEGRQRFDPQARHRARVEHAHARVQNYRRLLIRWDIRADIHQAFYTLALALICFHRLRKITKGLK
jgi:hypothetical protein